MTSQPEAKTLNDGAIDYDHYIRQSHALRNGCGLITAFARRKNPAGPDHAATRPHSRSPATAPRAYRQTMPEDDPFTSGRSFAFAAR